MLTYKKTKSGPQVRLWVSSETTLRNAMQVVSELNRFPEIYPEAEHCLDLLSKMVSPEPVPEGVVK